MLKQAVSCLALLREERGGVLIGGGAQDHTSYHKFPLSEKQREEELLTRWHR